MPVERKIVSFVFTGDDLVTGYTESRMGTSPTAADYERGIDHVLVRDSTDSYYWIHSIDDFEDWQDVDDRIEDYERMYGNA